MRNNKMSGQTVRSDDTPNYGMCAPISSDTGQASAEEGAILYGKMRNRDRAVDESVGQLYPSYNNNMPFTED